MDFAAAVGRIGAALGIGLLVGLQRQYARRDEPEDLFAGARTFALLGMSGALSAYAAVLAGSALVFGAGVLLAGAFVAIGYFASVREGDIGLTTEVAAFVTFLTGGLCVYGDLAVAAAVGVATTGLLALKPFTRRLVSQLDSEDVSATLKFAVLAALVLPLLPREPLGTSPFDAASPFKVGLMVVFISGLSFLGYVLIQVIGPRRGIGLTGILGGLVSSTAVTLTMSERSRSVRGLSRPLALAVLLAWAIMFCRILVEVGVVNPPLLAETALPIAAGAVMAAGWAAVLYLRDKPTGEGTGAETFSNPFRLGPAVQFGLLYGGILILSKAASIHLGDGGVYVSALVSGVADVDAITLSMSELSIGTGAISDEVAANAIALAAASNTLVKGGIVWALGRGKLRTAVVPGVVGAVGTTLALAFLI